MHTILTQNKSRIQLITLLILGFLCVHSQAQVFRVIDHKGTIIQVNNNQVTTSTTAPTNPLSNDVWFDNTDPNNSIAKVYDGTTWQPIKNSWLGNTTIHHGETTVLAITEALHNNADIHVELDGDLSIDSADVSDATNFYITNTTAVDRALTFTGFTGAYLRNGGAIADVATGGLTLKANTRYLCHITKNGSSYFFNATEAASGGGTGTSIADADGDTYIEVEETADEDHIHISTAGVERIRVGNTGLVEFGPEPLLFASLTPPNSTFQTIVDTADSSGYEWSKFIFGTNATALSLLERTYNIPFTNTTTKGIVEGSTATTIVGSIKSDYWVYVNEGIYLKVIKVQFQLFGSELQARVNNPQYRTTNQVAVADQNGTFFETGSWTSVTYTSQEIAVTSRGMIPASINSSNGESYFLGNVGIGNSTPNANAILDLTNFDHRALLLPSEAQPTDISSPTDGMMVYSSDRKNAYLRTDGVWKPMVTNQVVTTNQVSNELIFDGEDEVSGSYDDYYYVSFVINDNWKVMRYSKADVNDEKEATVSNNAGQTTQPTSLAICVTLNYF